MKHIVLLTTSYPISNDGSEAAGSFVSDFAETLSKYFKVTVLAPALEHGRVTKNRNLVISYFHVHRLPLSLISSYNPLNWAAIFKIIVSGYMALDSVFKKNRVDHIFAFWALPSGFWAYLANIKYKVSYSVWALGSDIWELGNIPIVRLLLKKVLQKSNANFADGYLLTDSVTEICGRKSFFLPSTRDLPTDINKKLAEKPPYKLAFLGRWHSNKGIDLLIESINMLDDSDWSLIAEIRIFGGGPLDKLVRKETERLVKMARPVSIGGYLNKKHAVRLLNWADYIVIPSRKESIPVIFSDAIKCLCPVVCMPVGDLTRIVNDYNVGLLSSNVSAEALLSAIREALKTSPLSFKDALLKTKNRFSIGSIVEEWIKIALNI